MCRHIKTLFNFDPPVTPEEVRAASLQFVRKITGFHHPSKANEAAFNAAIDELARTSSRLLHSLETTAPRRNREAQAARARARAAARFGTAKGCRAGRDGGRATAAGHDWTRALTVEQPHWKAEIVP